VLTGAAPLVSALANGFASAYADARACHRSLLLASVLGGALLHCLLPFCPPKLSVLLPLVLLSEAVAAPAVPLADAAIGLTLTDAGYSFSDYGNQRLWGAVSWGFIFAPAVGAIESFTFGRLHDAAPYVGHVVCSLLAFRAARSLHQPDTAAAAAASLTNDADQAPLTPAQRPAGFGALAAAVRATSGTPGFTQRVLLFTALGAALGVCDTFLFYMLRTLGGGTWLDGVALTVTCVSETAVFARAGAIEARLGATGCLHCVMVCYAARLLWYAAMPHMSSAWWVLPAQLLHGVTFGLYWAVGNAYMRSVAPPGAESTLQGLFQALTQLGSFLGLLLAGGMVQRAGAPRTFLATAGFIAAVQALFFATDDGDDEPAAAAEDESSVKRLHGVRPR